MKLNRRVTLGLVAGIMTALIGSTAFAEATTVNVSLWDNGPGAMDGFGTLPNMAPGMGTTDMNAAPMAITIDAATVKAGEVTFAVTNDSKDMIHEMILSPLPADNAPLPYLADQDRADEDASDHLGEVAELDPGAKGALTVTLTPGTYILYCNIPAHLVLGMWTTITVTE